MHCRLRSPRLARPWRRRRRRDPGFKEEGFSLFRLHKCSLALSDACCCCCCCRRRCARQVLATFYGQLLHQTTRSPSNAPSLIIGLLPRPPSANSAAGRIVQLNSLLLGRLDAFLHAHTCSRGLIFLRPRRLRVRVTHARFASHTQSAPQPGPSLARARRARRSPPPPAAVACTPCHEENRLEPLAGP